MNIPQAAPIAQPLPKAFETGAQNVADSFSGLKNNLSSTMDEFATQPGGPPEFKSSNTIIAKVVFIILVVIGFMILMNLGIKLITYFTQPANNPYVVSGLSNGSTNLVIPQDPKEKTSVLIKRSNNQSKGLEFTWSIWLYIDDLGNDAAKFQHIFSKGDNLFNDSNIAKTNNAPGLYLHGNNNVLRVMMDTVNSADKNNYIDIQNVPLKKWFHVTIRMQNTVMDVYVNGTISGRLNLQNVPKQNYNDVFVSQNGGFRGNLSDLRYFSSALNVFEINTIVMRGPTLKTKQPVANPIQNYSYLSNLWYASKL